ncbi:uncharacterized protein [Oscarella lobularis]|uniref:uncharacterized protein n=1 Tax=Oscarella lobularis TaxID=121494 RepID=UPI00331380F5
MGSCCSSSSKTNHEDSELLLPNDKSDSEEDSGVPLAKKRHRQYKGGKPKTMKDGIKEMREVQLTSIENQLKEMQKVQEKHESQLNETSKAVAYLFNRLGVPTPNTRIGVSYEKDHYKDKYKQIVTRLLKEIGLGSVPTHHGASPDDDTQSDVIFHFASIPTDRLVNLDSKRRQNFDCHNVILILLRSGKNDGAFKTYWEETDEYSGIFLGENSQIRFIVQILHFDRKWVENSAINQKNVALLQSKVKLACPHFYSNDSETP